MSHEPGSGPGNRLPEKVRAVLIAASLVVGLGAAMAPVVYLLRRLGVG